MLLEIRRGGLARGRWERMVSIVAEETDLNTKEIIWRPMADLDEAKAFVADRQEAYEALWAGA